MAARCGDSISKTPGYNKYHPGALPVLMVRKLTSNPFVAMPAFKSLLSALALAGWTVACAHDHDGEVVPEHKRAELLEKWDQEVYIPEKNSCNSC